MMLHADGVSVDLANDLALSSGCGQRHLFLHKGVAAALIFMLLGCVQASPPDNALSVSNPTRASSVIKVRPQRDWSDAIIYFVLIDRFADGDSANNRHVDRKNPGGYHGGDFKGLTAQLDEIAELGATAIWINPVVKQIDAGLWAQGPPQTGTASGFEHWGFHGYWADDFTAIEPHFGSEEELKQLVEAAHTRGIKVLLDVVYNHPGYDSRYTRGKYKSWIRAKNVDCDQDPITCRVGGLPDFNTELPEVREYLLDTTLALAKRVGVDGFRLDTVKHIDHPFWQQHRERTREQLGKDFFLLGEVWGGSYRVLDEWFVNDEVDAGFDFTFKGSCQSFVNGRGRAVAFAAYLKKRHKVREGYHLAHYLSSHDEPMSLYELGNDKEKFKLCVALQMTILGMPVIYYGEEVGRKGSIWPVNRTDMPWGRRDIRPGKGQRRDEELRNYYIRLIQIRRSHPVLSEGDFRELVAEGDLLAFIKEDQQTGEAAIVAVNRGEQRMKASVQKPAAWNNSVVIDALSGMTIGPKIEPKNEMLAIDVPAKSVRIYLTKE